MSQLQQINLFDEGMLHGRHWRRWRAVLLLLLLLLLSEFGYLGMLVMEEQQQAQHIVALEIQQAGLSENEKSLQQQLVKRRGRVSVIEQRITGLGSEQTRLQNLVAVLRDESGFTRSGFSSLLESLAYSSEEGAYLTQFNLLHGGEQVQLRGYAVEADQLTRYINRLLGADQFRGARVDRLQLLRDVDGEGGGNTASWFAFEVDLSRATDGGSQ